MSVLEGKADLPVEYQDFSVWTHFGPIEIEKALSLDGTEGLRRAPLRP